MNEYRLKSVGLHSAVGSASESRARRPGFNTRSGHILSFVLPLTQEGQLSVTGESMCTYRKNSKNWDTLNYYRDCPTNGIVGFYSAILRSKDADRITNRVDTDQTAP